MQTNFFSIGLSGLKVAQAGLAVTAHNTSNQATQGYHRQLLSVASNKPLNYGHYSIGQGAHVDSIYRVQNEFLQRQIEKTTARLEYLRVKDYQLGLIENTLGDADLSLQSTLSSFYAAMNALGTNSSAGAGQIYSSANTLVTHFNQVMSTLGQLMGSQEQDKKGIIQEINKIAQGIAQLNGDIASFGDYDVSDGAVYDLLDRRDQLMVELNQYVKADVIRQSDGSFQVVLGGGLCLVQGNKAAVLTMNATTGNVNFKPPTGDGNINLSADFLAGGQLAGVLSSQKTLNDLKISLSQGLLSFAHKFNAQHQLGVYYNAQGVPEAGKPFFQTSGLTAINSLADADTFFSAFSVLIPQSEVALGSGMTATVTNDTLGVSHWLQIDPSLSSATNDNLNSVIGAGISLTYSSGAWNAPPGMTVVPNGGNGYYVQLPGGQRLHFKISSVSPVQDGATIQFNVQTVPPQAQDVNNAIGLAALQNVTVANGENLENYLTSTISNFAFEFAGNKRSLDIEEKYVASLWLKRDNLSAVNPDEEAANLMFYQQMYQACAKTMQVSNQVLDELFAIVR